MRRFAFAPRAARFHRRISPRIRRSAAAFTIPELLVVVGIIALLIAMLVPALAGGLRVAQMTDAKSRMRQIFTWMTSYSGENREYIVPSQFDYSAAAAISPVKVRSYAGLPPAEQYRGNWTDILWTYASTLKVAAANDQYLYDSPDAAYYAMDPDYDDNPFRSPGLNRRDYTPGDGVATGVPNGAGWGTGAQESGQPGYFAANNFFNLDPDDDPATPQVWYVTGQIRMPDRSMYLVDSLAGETIEPVDVDEDPDSPWHNPAIQDPPIPATSLQVDFRYNNACLMLFLDGHSGEQGPSWVTLQQLEDTQKIKVRNLDQR